MSNRLGVTTDPQEWAKVTEEWVGKEDLWQNVYFPTVYSIDAGRTYYDLSEVVDSDGNPNIYNSKEHTRA